MDSTILLLLAVAALLAGGAIAWALIQPETKRVPVRQLPSRGLRQR